MKLEHVHGFEDRFEFLSNLYPSRILCPAYPDLVCATVEHAFQACKPLDLGRAQSIVSAKNAGLAKHLGRIAPLRPD